MAGGPGGLHRPHARHSQLLQWSTACLALHHGEQLVRSHVGAAFGSGAGILAGGAAGAKSASRHAAQEKPVALGPSHLGIAYTPT